MKLRVKPILLSLCLIPFGLAAGAQKTDGSVTGQVTDATGAAVPHVQVQLNLSGKGIHRAVTTNGSGEYTFNDVGIGVYEVDVAAPGFQRSATKGVIVNVATSTRADVHLNAGSVSETVEVNADALQVQTDSGALGSIVDGVQVKELPLNGRSFVELTQLTPGVSAANNFDSKNKGLQGGVDFSVNGNPTTNNLFLVDGANDNDVGSNRTILVYPSVDAIAEFKMLTNSYGVEYGQASGAVISIATRSGSNTFHGSAFYSGRNDALAAYTYFARRNAGTGAPLNGKDKLRRNDWGYSIGGPIKKDKLFFFFNEEWNHEIRGFTQNSCVPTAAERAGDFTNPSCGAPAPTGFPTALQKNGNPRVLNAIDPAGALIEQYYPLPNLAQTNASGYNWSVSLPSFLKYRQENARIDYNLSKRNALMFRYTQDTWSNPSYNGNQYWGDSAFPTLNGNWAQPSKMAIARWTSTISDTLVNDAEFAYSNNRINITPGGTNPGLLNQLNSAIPTLYSQTLKTASASTPTIWSGLQYYGNYTTVQSIAPWSNSLDLYTFRDDVSKVKGRHSLKVGLFLGFDGKNEDTDISSIEHPTFQPADYAVDTSRGGTQQNNVLANLLVPNQPFLLSETSTNIRSQVRWRDYEFYAGDTWKITPRVTLTYGVRYSLLPPPFQPNNQLTSFQPQLYDKSKPASDTCNGLWVAPGQDPCGAANKRFGTAFSSGTPGPNKYLMYTNHHLIAPRVGIAWDVRGDGKTAIRLGGGQFFQRERVSRYTLVSNAPFAINVSNVSRALGGATPATLPAGTASPKGGMDPSALIPNSFQWNATVEQELAKNTVFQISYVGNRGMHLTSSYDINTVDPANWIPATFAQGAAVNALKPFSNYGPLTYWSHNGDSNYHSLQSLFRTQVGAFHLQAAYTWSHGQADIATDDSSGGIGTQSFTYFRNPSLDKGNSATNRPNIFVANGTYFLPQLKGRNPIVKQTLGGWELTGITSADSGNSFTIFQNTPNVGGNAGSLVNLGTNGMLRPLLTGANACNTGSGIRGDQAINPNAFTLNGYHLGTLDPNMARRGVCSGPKLVNTDFSIDKNWKIKDRITVQFRLDAFDLLNHANFRADGIRNTNPIISASCNGVCTATNNVITSSNIDPQFGKATNVVGNAQRQFQYGMHIEF